MLIYNLRRRIVYPICYLMGFLFALLLVLLLLCASDGTYPWTTTLFACVAYVLVYAGVVLLMFALYPIITLDEHGVTVQIFRKKRSYLWSDIQQAGVLFRRPGSRAYNDLLLLKPGGSPRGYRDKSFERRNIGKIIYIEVTEEIRNFVVKHYGPLDFDLSDGRPEGRITEN